MKQPRLHVLLQHKKGCAEPPAEFTSRNASHWKASQLTGRRFCALPFSRVNVGSARTTKQKHNQKSLIFATLLPTNLSNRNRRGKHVLINVTSNGLGKTGCLSKESSLLSCRLTRGRGIPLAANHSKVKLSRNPLKMYHIGYQLRSQRFSSRWCITMQ